MEGIFSQRADGQTQFVSEGGIAQLWLKVQAARNSSESTSWVL